ncbi:uncharacterized protein [Montipora foliosa]|uniref:uncharacterized protein n=1 Tax=Montipora foliosa TaxID=591990 RepID=UPI0035F10BD7
MSFNDPWAARHDRQKVDLVFIVDCTGSMGPYIKQAQKHIRTIAETVSRTAFSVKLALVEYKDHPPQDRTFITRVHDFTLSLSDMKTWVDGMRASGGGDGPESVACALHEATKLSFREDSTKMCVLIADAPPHGLGRDMDGFPDGCPTGNDPMKACRTMVEKGIVLYSVGCEPAILRHKDFFMGMAFMTGGQYVPLSQAQALSKVIINGTLEEVSQENLMGYIEDFMTMELENCPSEEKITVSDLATKLERHLSLRNVKCQQLQCNNNPLEPATANAKKIAGQKNLAGVRKLLENLTSTDCSHNSFFNQRMTTVEVTLTEPAPVTKSQCERLLIKEFGRSNIPVTHDELTGELIIEEL